MRSTAAAVFCVLSAVLFVCSAVFLAASFWAFTTPCPPAILNCPNTVSNESMRAFCSFVVPAPEIWSRLSLAVDFRTSSSSRSSLGSAP